MKNTTKIIVLSALSIFASFIYANNVETFSLTVKIEGLRNSEGMVQFALYNKDDSIPDVQYKKYYRIQTVNINNGSSYTIFNDLPKGRYAVSALHDENMNERIDRGLFYPLKALALQITPL